MNTALEKEAAHLVAACRSFIDSAVSLGGASTTPDKGAAEPFDAADRQLARARALLLSVEATLGRLVSVSPEAVQRLALAAASDLGCTMPQQARPADIVRAFNGYISRVSSVITMRRGEATGSTFTMRDRPDDMRLQLAEPRFSVG